MPTDAPDKARVIALPPLIVGPILALGLLIHLIWPVRLFFYPYTLWLGVFLILISVPIVGWAAHELRKAKTAFDVRKPTTEIVTRGVFGISRNPTYLSMVLGFLGIALLINSLWLLLLAIPLVVTLQRGVIDREERYLEQKFGDEFLVYKARVRRWV